MTTVNKGLVLVLLASICAALAPVFAKSVTNSTNVLSSNLFWFTSAAIWATIYVLATKNTKLAVREVKQHPWKLIGIGLLDAIATFFWFFGLVHLTSAETEFLSKTMFFFSLFLGLYFLKEKLCKKEFIGLLVIIAGIVIMSYTPLGLNYWVFFPIASALFYSLANYLRKRYVTRISIATLVSSRAWLIVLVTLPPALIFSGIQLPSKEVLLIVAIIPLFSAVLQHVFATQAYHHMDFNKVWLLMSITPFFVLVYAFLLRGEIPLFKQIVGGVILLGGTLLLVKKTIVT
jgi:drug/metabolite transporter (DMT)-like permease